MAKVTKTVEAVEVKIVEEQEKFVLSLDRDEAEIVLTLLNYFSGSSAQIQSSTGSSPRRLLDEDNEIAYNIYLAIRDTDDINAPTRLNSLRVQTR